VLCPYGRKSIRQKAALGWQRARGKKGKELEILGGNNSKTVVTAVINAVVAIRRTTIPRITVPRTAAYNSSTTLRMIIIPATSIPWRIGRVLNLWKRVIINKCKS